LSCRAGRRVAGAERGEGAADGRVFELGQPWNVIDAPGGDRGAKLGHGRNARVVQAHCRVQADAGSLRDLGLLAPAAAGEHHGSVPPRVEPTAASEPVAARSPESIGARWRSRKAAMISTSLFRTSTVAP